MPYKRKEKMSILKTMFRAFILGVVIIMCGGTVVGIGIKTWINNDFYSFVSNVVGTVHIDYPEIEEQVMNSLTNRDYLDIKMGNDILYKNGYSKDVFRKGQVGPSIIVGIIALIIVATIVVVLLFWKDVLRIKEGYISNIRVLIWVGIAIVAILLSGIKIGEILSDWSSERYHSFVGEIAGNLANEDRQKNHAAEKFVRAVLDLEYTNNGDSVLKEYGYNYGDFIYTGGAVVILAGMMAVTPLAIYFIILYLYMHQFTSN